MSEEQKKSSSYMQQLDAWTDANVVFPLINAEPKGQAFEETVENVKRPSAKRSCRVTRTGALRVWGMRRKICQPGALSGADETPIA